MAVALQHSQDLPLAWTPTPDDSMKRAAPTAPSPAQHKDTKKRTRAETDVAETPVKLEPSHDRSDDDRKSTTEENHASAANRSDESDETDVKWPTLARKRQRMTEEERKARHREVQRQFMQRKLAKLDEMRKLVVVLEKQFMLLQLTQERARLEHENDYLQRRVLANPPHWTHEHPHEMQRRMQYMTSLPPLVPPPAHAHTHPGVHAHPHHSVPPHRPPTGMLPWDEILEAVSEANV